MALTKCKECGHEVSVNANKCPNCGVNNPGVKAKALIAGLAIVLAIGFMVAKCSSDNNEAKNDDVTAAPESSRQANEPIEPKIKPEMTVSFAQGTVACLSKDELLQMTMHALKGERTKTNSMVGCTMISSSKKVKVLSVEYNNDETPDIGIMEIVGAESKSSNGAWAYTIGAKETTP